MASLAGLALLVSLASNEARANTQPQQLFLSTLATLRNQDPSVASVKARILAAPRQETGCGNTGNSDEVAFYCQLDRTIYVSLNTLNSIRAFCCSLSGCP